MLKTVHHGIIGGMDGKLNQFVTHVLGIKKTGIYINGSFVIMHIHKMNIPDIIRSYSKKEIFIEVIADGYKLEGVGICWRGYVHWKEKGNWAKEDCGCYPEWEDAFKSSIKFIQNCILL